MQPILALCLTAPLLVEPGDAVSFRFQKPLLNALGTTSLEDLRGKPLLVFFWGTQSWGASEYMKDLFTWQQQWGEDLAIVLVENQGADEKKIEAFALKWKWLGSRMMWTVEQPVDLGLVATPQFGLYSNEGELLLKGAAEMWGMALENRQMDAIEDAITAQVALRRAGPAGAPKSVAAAYAAFAKGDVAQAFELLQRAKTEPDAAEAADHATTELTHRLDRRLAEARWLLDQGRIGEFEALMAQLGLQLAGRTELLPRYEELRTAMKAEGYAAEREAAAELERLLDPIFKKGLKKTQLGSLEKLAKRHAGTRSAARAQELVALAALDV